MVEPEDRIVINRYNGRDTEYLIPDPAGGYVFHLLIIGHVEAYDLWLEVNLSDDEAEKFLADPIIKNYVKWLGTLPDREAIIRVLGSPIPDYITRIPVGQSAPDARKLLRRTLKQKAALPANVLAQIIESI